MKDMYLIYNGEVLTTNKNVTNYNDMNMQAIGIAKVCKLHYSGNQVIDQWKNKNNNLLIVDRIMEYSTDRMTTIISIIDEDSFQVTCLDGNVILSDVTTLFNTLEAKQIFKGGNPAKQAYMMAI